MDATTIHNESAGNNDLIIAKVVAMLVLGLSSFLLGVLPIKLAKLPSFKSIDGDKNLFLSLLLCFGGGVLLFTTFLHLQPEVREFFASLEGQNKLHVNLHGIPPSELVFCLGFFFVYLIEELVHLVLDKKTHDETLHRSFSLRCSSRKNDNLNIPRVTLTKFDDGNISYISNSNKELLNSQTTINIERQKAHHHHHVIEGTNKNPLSGFLAVVALSFHAIFEGLAVGLEGSVEKVWYLFGAIATHKLVIGFCVGIELVSSKTKAMLVVLYIGTFAVVTPLGLLLIKYDRSLFLTNYMTMFGDVVKVKWLEVKISRDRLSNHFPINST